MTISRGIALLVTFIQHFLFCLNLLSGPHGPHRPQATRYHDNLRGSLLLPKVKTFKPSSDFSNKQMYVKDVFKIQGLYILYTLRTPEKHKNQPWSPRNPKHVFRQQIGL